MLSNYSFAIHLYANYTCHGDGFDFNYDGPRSNHAVGGYSYLYKKINGERLKVLAIDESVFGSEESSVGEISKTGPWVTNEEYYSEENVGIVLNNFKTLKRKFLKNKSTKIGDKCTPQEFDYIHSETKSLNLIEVLAISKEASKKFNLKVGSVLKMNCLNTSDIPDTCPKSGRWEKSNIE